MDRIDALRLFVRVAETGAFSRAAIEAGVGQPTVSRAISRLETDFGAQLFLRSTRQVHLTEAGQHALDRAIAVLEDFDAMDAELRGLEQEPVGLLRISSSIAFARAELVPHVPAFLKAHPHVELDLATADHRVDIVAEGVDLAFRFGVLSDSSLTSRPLRRYEWVLVAAPSLLAGRPALAAPDDLKTIPCAAFTSTTRVHSWTLQRGTESIEIEITSQVRARTGRVVLDFARLGLGVALLPDFLVRAPLEAGDLVRVLPDWSGPPMELNAVWASGRRLPRRARAFLEFIAPKLSTN